MKMVVSGASGLVGLALTASLVAGGNRVRRLVRREPDQGAGDIAWDPAAGRLGPADLEGVDAVVHLGGESIASGRWSEEKRKRIRDSRVGSTRLLAETLARMERPPQVLICASAVGYYGDRGHECLSEEAAAGKSFLAQVCAEWEAAAEPARAAGIRVVNLRFGVVLAPNGGALRQMLPLFRLGLGGRLGTGDQYWSWIGIDDAVGAVEHVLAVDSLSGPVNVTAPVPVTNREFTAVLARVLRRPAWLPAPSAALRLALGPMADELLLASTRALPKQLLDSGYVVRHAELESALRYLLNESR